ncbi:MAG: family 1 encapsulin nanocompartment shell protein [Acidimicrobiales bacterium]
MNHLNRELAPISDAAWEAIDDEAKTRLTTYLAARKLVEFAGPHGWEHSATNLGRTAEISGPSEGVAASQRRVLPLVELRAEFRVSRVEADDAERGASDVDLPELDEAARQIALGENVMVFHGYQAAGIRGITESSSHQPIVSDPDMERFPTGVARAVDVLRQAGIDGPYGMAICPEVYTVIVETTEHGGYLLFDHLRQILGGPLVWAPGIQGGVVLSLRGGDFVLDCGQDLSIGYLGHDADVVRLYLEESVSFRVLEPDAAVALRVGS